MRGQLGAILLLFLAGCTSGEQSKVEVQPKFYFNLKGYIAKESKRHAQQNTLVNKSVTVNNEVEEKEVKIKNWDKELSAFSDADINKSAWEGMFKVVRTGNQDSYSTENKKIPVKSVVINHNNGKVRSIVIRINNENMLYSSNDTLFYYPDSLYQIKKTQHIKMFTSKHYEITGRF